jgi:NAD(P)H-hydrate repair Nnr-like enzyme with NAD(P)H-hydrate dehydratase domain
LQAQLKARAGRGRGTVITPHPLEAARLLGRDTAEVQARRLAAANDLAQRFGCVAVLKGSGSITAAPGQLPFINFSGNAKLATAGTGDVLAGMIAARMARGEDVFSAAHQAVQSHGERADRWPDELAFTASRLARSNDGPNPRTKASCL